MAGLTVRFHGICPVSAAFLGEGTEMDYSVVPYRPLRVELCLDVWNGEDLLATAGVLAASPRLREALEQQGLTGFAMATLDLSVSPFFESLHRGQPAPSFYWLRAHGTPWVDDFSDPSSVEFDLLVSDRALDTLKRFSLGRVRVFSDVPRPRL